MTIERPMFPPRAEAVHASIPPGLAVQELERRTALHTLARLRKEASAEIERLLVFLDASDPYASTELEAQIDDGPIDDNELEPSLCGITAENNFGFGDTREDKVDLEREDGNDEPSLGWTDEEAARGRYADRRDLEEQCEDEGETFSNAMGGAA